MLELEINWGLGWNLRKDGVEWNFRLAWIKDAT
jgi:hypothetical protein